MEPEVIQQADVLLTNSDFFADFGLQYTANSYMVGQGCDVSHFSDDEGTIQVPAEFKDVPSPVIGYVGSLTSLRLDISLLEYMAEQRKTGALFSWGQKTTILKNQNCINCPMCIFWE